MNYSIDAFRDLTGTEECKRPSYPNLIKSQSSNVKKLLAGLAIAGSLATTGILYSLAPKNQQADLNHPPAQHQIQKERYSHTLERELYFE